jgi:hypothetical protein
MGTGWTGVCLLEWAPGSGVQHLLPAPGSQACWFVPSVIHGLLGALGSGYAAVQVSLLFQGEE